MRTCILQPSYLPWKGVFHQIAQSDVFVFFDTVQYDKRGWRNRNKIKTPTGPDWLTISVHAKGSHQGLLIKDVMVSERDWAQKHLRAIALHYKQAPYFSQEFPWVEDMLRTICENLTHISQIGAETTQTIARRLGLHNTRFIYASELNVDAQEPNERLIQIVRAIGGSTYISGPSAQDYMDLARFERAAIDVTFMQYHYPEYEQLYPPFTHTVSILDMIFMLGAERVGAAIWDNESPQWETDLPPEMVERAVL